MNNVLQANFVDIKTVKTRKCVQIVFEMPLERLKDIIDVLGAPDPSIERHCVIARLNDHAIEKRKFHEFKNSQQMALKLQDKAFTEWLKNKKGIGGEKDLKMFLGIESKATLDINDTAALKWKSMLIEYEDERLGRL